MSVAQTILKQLGGNRFIVMTGSYNFVSSDNRLTMHLRKNNLKAKYLTITLNSMDTYDLKFSSFNRKLDEVIKSEIKNVHCSDLQKIFTNETGLYINL